MKQLLTFSVLLFSFSSFGQNFPSIIDSLICRLSGNHSIVHLVGEDAVEKTYFFDSLGKNTFIKTVFFIDNEDVLESLHLNSKQTHDLYKKIELPEIIKFDSINLLKNQVLSYYNHLNFPKDTLLIKQVKSKTSKDSSILSINGKFGTHSYFYKNDSIVKLIDTFNLYSMKNKDLIEQKFINAFYVKYDQNTIFIISDNYYKCYSIDLEKMTLEEHLILTQSNQSLTTRFNILKEKFENDDYENSFEIHFYNSKDIIPIVTKKKRLKQYKKFHKSFSSELQLR